MPAYRLLRAILIGLAVVFASAVHAQTWPATWIPLPGVDDEPEDRDESVGGAGGYTNADVDPWLDFVGGNTIPRDTTSPYFPGGYVADDATNLYFRMRLDGLGTAEQMYGDQLYIYINTLAITPAPTHPPTTIYAPDYAIRYTWATATDPAKLDLIQLITTPPRQKWFGLETGNTIALDLGTGDSYLRFTTPTGDGSLFKNTDDAFVDWAINRTDLYNAVLAATGHATNYHETWHIQYASNDISSDKPNPLEDIGGGEVGHENEAFDGPEAGDWSVAFSTPEPASTALTLLALGIVGGAVRRRKPKADGGPDQAT